MTNTTTKKRQHLYEIDFMRIFFTLGVLFNHTVNQFTSVMTDGNAYYTIRSARVMFHYTRMGFIFISGIVLTMTYFKKHDWPKFLRKRFGGSIWPYLSWNALLMFLMILVGNPNYSLNSFGNKYFTIVLHGSSFYLYYMLLVMQLYLLFPVIVYLFQHFTNHHSLILSISFTIQLLLDFWIKYGMSQADTSSWPYWIKAVSINIFAYQFYIFFGVYTWLYHKKVYDFLDKHIKKIAALAILMAFGMIIYYRIWNQQYLHLDSDHALSLHQPYIVCYDIIMLSLIFWIGKKYAKRQAQGLPIWLESLMDRAVKVSFGMYLNQTIGLLIISTILNTLSLPNWLLIVLIPVGWITVIFISFELAWICYKVTPLGFLVGRPNWHPLKKQNISPIKNISTYKD
ncbi:acyltransferase family protein [Liquorilactobacillus hordei]|uniref:acyltransferase family protein n=1 Tax=Liquorilactobacillus hordei TaxID=468911 RepID=UPI001CBE5000|nr:acyltransferase [Liquorilactobacillus hordei]MBZ2405670.1 acyltransferase [Liquorilactobacillus hordei]